MRKTNKNAVLVFVLLLLVAVSAMMVASTYAKYTAEVTGSGTVTVAKWNFATDNANPTVTVNITPTADPTTLVANKIAPGTQGSFDVTLKNTSEVGADFKVTIGTITGTVPANLKFYKDSGFTTEITASAPITGQLKAGDSTGIPVKVYWKWAYETGTVTDGIATGDADDTTAGTTPATLTVPLTIKGVQTQPSATAITSHIDN